MDNVYELATKAEIMRARLTPMQAKFVELYVKSNDAKGAALAAGYTESVAARAAFSILSKEKVQDYATFIRERDNKLVGEYVTYTDVQTLLQTSTTVTKETQLATLENAKVAIMSGIGFLKNNEMIGFDIVREKGANLPKYIDALVKIINEQNRMLGIDKPKEGEGEKPYQLDLNFVLKNESK